MQNTHKKGNLHSKSCKIPIKKVTYVVNFVTYAIKKKSYVVKVVIYAIKKETYIVKVAKYP